MAKGFLLKKEKKKRKRKDRYGFRVGTDRECMEEKLVVGNEYRFFFCLQIIFGEVFSLFLLFVYLENRPYYYQVMEGEKLENVNSCDEMLRKLYHQDVDVDVF